MRVIKAGAFLTITIQRAERTTQTQALSAPRAQVPQNQLSGLAQGINQAAGTVNQIIAKEAAEQDASRIKKASTDYERARNSFLYGSTDDQGNQTAGLLHTVGEQAVNPEGGITLDRQLEEWQKSYKAEQLPLLGNDRQRDMFTQTVDAAYPSAQSAVAKHEFRQGQVVKQGNARAATETATETAIALGNNPTADPVLYQDAIDQMKEAVQVQAMLEGFSPESDYAVNLLSEKTSKLHTNIIVTKVSNDDDQGAIDYYDAHSDEITDPREKRVIGEKITKIKTRVAGKDVAAEVWEAQQPEDVNGLIDLESMREEIRQSDASEDVKAVALKRVEEHVQEYLQQAKAKQEEVSNSIYAMAIDGSTYDQVIKAITLNTDIDNGAKENLYSWADRRFQISQQRSEAKNVQSLEQLAMLMSFQNEYLNGDYGTLTPEQVATKAGELGQYTDNAMTYVQQVNDNLGQAKVTDAELKDLIYTLGQNDQYALLLPNLLKPTPSDKARFALLQDAVIDIMARSKDKPGAGKSTQAALLEAISKVKTDDGWLWDTEDQLYLIGTEMASDYAKGNDPSKWSKEAQENYIRAKWSQRPSNNGKTLDPETLERYRQTLLRTGE